jgi:Gluconate 2-dehydrogenase subunit 3
MKKEHASRRQFLISSISGLSATWLSSHWPSVVTAQTHAEEAARQDSAFQFFSPQQATEVEAITSQIIPSDETPGGREAHVVYFIDRALTSFDRDKQPAYIEGLKQVQALVKSLFPGETKFSDLSSERQIRLLMAIERTDFFELLRIHTVMGFLAKPDYGGNQDEVGWKLIGFEDKMSHHPPFGYYDREYNKNNKPTT